MSVEPVPVAERVGIETTPQKKRRFRWLIVVGIVLVLLVAAFVVADALAKQFAAGYVRDRIVGVLKLDPGTPVDVDLGSGSILLQAATGAIDRVDVRVERFGFGDVVGSAQLTATKVPLDSAQPVDHLGIVMTVDQQNVQKLSGYLSGVGLKSIELKDGLIRVSTDLDLTFLTVPVAVDLQPGAKDGGITFDPVSILLGEQQISVADLRANPLVGALAGQLLASRDFCVAGYLPKALTVDHVDVVGTDLVISINGDGTALSGPGLSTMGTCP